MDMWLVFLMLILLTRFSQRRASWLHQFDQHLKEMGDGPSIQLGGGQMEASGEPTGSGRSDVLLWRMLPDLT